MKIYKFKDLSDASKDEHFLDIVLCQLIWCASPSLLKDDREFCFELDYTPSSKTESLLTELMARHSVTSLSPALSASWALNAGNLQRISHNIIDMVIKNSKNGIGISSFSMRNDEPWLWKEYGGDGNGVYIEILLPDSLVGERYHVVNYLAKNIFHIDTFLEAGLYPDKVEEVYRNILLTKIKEPWQAEQEVRFIGKQQNAKFKIDGEISRIVFGPKVSEERWLYFMNLLKDQYDRHKIQVLKNVKINN